MIPRFGVYLFDVDDTLVDSAADICGAIQQVLAETPQNQISDEVLRSYIGRHLLDLLDDLFPQLSAEQKEKLVVHLGNVIAGEINHFRAREKPP